MLIQVLPLAQHIDNWVLDRATGKVIDVIGAGEVSDRIPAKSYPTVKKPSLRNLKVVFSRLVNANNINRCTFILNFYALFLRIPVRAKPSKETVR